MIAINIHMLEFDLDNKYFYIKSQEKLLNKLNRKKSIRIPDLQS